MRIVFCRRPRKLFRYSQKQWLLKTLHYGEFRLMPASVYGELVTDPARLDNELLRIRKSPADQVKIKVLETGQELNPIGDVIYRSEILTNYYILCFSTSWATRLFDEFKGSDACLVIHEPDEVCERIHFYSEKALKGWSPLDAKVTYGGKSDFGAFYLKDKKYAGQNEWRFTWCPPTAVKLIDPIKIVIGSIEKFAELQLKPRQINVSVAQSA